MNWTEPNKWKDICVRGLQNNIVIMGILPVVA